MTTTVAEFMVNNEVVIRAEMPTFEIFKQKARELHDTVPYCYGARAGAAEDLHKEYAKIGFDTSEHLESLRRQSGRLWNYTGD